MKAAGLGLGMAILIVLLGNAVAQTQTRTATIYRCGADGRDLRDSPCPPSLRSSATRLEFDQPSVVQTQAARAQVIAQAQQGRDMEAQRRNDESQSRLHASHAVGINGLATAASAPKAAPPPVTPKAPKLAKPYKPNKPNKPAVPAASAPR